MTNTTLTSLSDADLLAETVRIAQAARRTTSQLLTLLSEVDTRKLYLGLGYSSLFTYCTQALHLSEAAAYTRITVARVARRFPVLLELLTDGAVNVTIVSLLAAHLTDENHEALLEAARHKTRREVEHLVACLDPQPDVASLLRRMPERHAVAETAAEVIPPTPRAGDVPLAEAPVAVSAPPSSRRAVVAPLAADRYLLRITLSQVAHEKLVRARALLRHQIPTGDAALVVERALTVLVEQLERTKHGATRRPQRHAPAESTSRHVPADVKRTVWTRDEGRCAFIGVDGRCAETGFLEFHHVVPFAAGGPTTVDNLELRCRAHNTYEATCLNRVVLMATHRHHTALSGSRSL
jgi:5-methylcytosine-specific restriction endonuclease McrA